MTRSASVHPEHREYERFSTAIVNAALVPLMQGYLAGLAERVGGARLSILQSSGGALDAETAAREPVRVILSGPAGGVVGAAHAAREAGFDAFVGLDMGGTSTDVSFHDAATAGERARRASEPIPIAGHPVGVPSLDIHTIGCGGGSLVSIDPGGILHVGPDSAGASPGPVCYGKSEVPTVTDAHVLLGHIDQGRFLAGELPLAKDAVERAFARVGERLGVDAREAARGVLDVANAAMRRAIGVMTMQRGQDPERVPLVAFGGAGGLCAAALVESLRMKAALVPRFPGALSARGMSTAEATRDPRAHGARAARDVERGATREGVRRAGSPGSRLSSRRRLPARATCATNGAWTCATRGSRTRSTSPSTPTPRPRSIAPTRRSTATRYATARSSSCACAIASASPARTPTGPGSDAARCRAPACSDSAPPSSIGRAAPPSWTATRSGPGTPSRDRPSSRSTRGPPSCPPDGAPP